MITFEDFKKLDVRIGCVKSAEKVLGADKLLKLIFDFGPEIGDRQIISGIAEYFTPESLVGKFMPVLINLEPKIFRGLESQGMILAADVDGRPVLLQPADVTPQGSLIK